MDGGRKLILTDLFIIFPLFASDIAAEFLHFAPMESQIQEFYAYKLARVEQEIIENRREEGTRGSMYELFSPDGLHFWHSDLPGGPRVVKVNNDTPYIQLNFSISGNNRYRTKEAEASFAQLGSHEYNIFYYPAGGAIAEWQTDDRNEIFGLNLLPSLFMQYLPGDHPLTSRMEDVYASERAVAISDYNLPVTPKIKSILYEIVHCPLNSHYKRLYLKAKAMELLMLLFSHYEEHIATAPDAAPALRQAEVQKMQQAREILHQNLQKPCSLIDLAHQVGTNENYLKKHFKQVFGHTVYGYVQELRMQEARHLLMNEECDIHEVAQRTGYKRTTHFITAFKKHFGYAPLRLKMWWIGFLLNYPPALFMETACAA